VSVGKPGLPRSFRFMRKGSTAACPAPLSSTAPGAHFWVRRGDSSMKPMHIAAAMIAVAAFMPVMSLADDAALVDSRVAGGWSKLPAMDELKHEPERMIAGTDIVACFEVVAKDAQTVCYFTDNGVLFKVAQWGVTRIVTSQDMN
jgi:hypothetical protein